MSTNTYWERVNVDPANYCPERGEYPHPRCEVDLYERGGPWSHIYGGCHGHKTIWHLQSGGASRPGWPTLAELDEGYRLTHDPGPLNHTNRKDTMTRTKPDTLTSIVEELSCWPGGTTVPIHGLAERLRHLIGERQFNEQEVAWCLDLDGRYSGQALSPELDDRVRAGKHHHQGGRMRYEMVQCNGVGCLEDNVHTDDRRHLGWIVGPDGEDLCPRCWAACQEALVAELGPDFELGPGPELEIRLRPKEQLGFF